MAALAGLARRHAARHRRARAGAAITLSFAAVHLAPGDIVGILIGEQLSTPEIEAAIRQEWGLDEPLALQYVHYLWRVLHGEFGARTS